MDVNFTDEVIAFLATVDGGRSARVALMEKDGVPAEQLPTAIQSGMIRSLTPFMDYAPSLVQKITAKALVVGTDWNKVASFIEAAK